ncbi:MAG: pyruvate ferredoxin oxidoreductase [bacterium (Candidatus Stahlbacteria) CG23_combo_of_CG06-09_8_20_14_all_34_7]|nr:MAG: pyruvate ferredoxin oxidoreductase [bacterium (Candidatus Stahlbacteria) CG23_combo_of_CG06-09_8_20_14_all_34_7]
MTTIKELANTENLFTSGHRACAGCGGTVILRLLMAVAGKDTVIVGATGCMEVVSTIYPYTAWNVPFLHNAFENSAATASGVESAYRALLKKNNIKKKINFIAFGGDGGTYDIGLQSLSGAMERGHNMLYVCYDNEAYMNTGIQRSSATPFGSNTTTSPAGSVIKGKMQNRKDLTEIMVAHNLQYVAQASPAHWSDFVNKVKKALAIDGPTFINVLSPCPLGWGYDPSLSIELARLAVDTHFWPIYEYENEKYTINIKPKQVKPLEDFLFTQARFKHLKNEPALVEELKRFIEKRWNMLLQKENFCK